MKNARRLLPALAVSALLMSGVRSLAQGGNQPQAYVARPAVSPPARPTQTDLQWQNRLQSFASAQLRDGRELSEEVLAQRQIAALAPAKFDRDGNGRFDPTEFNAWLGAVRAAIVDSPSAMKRFDTDSNGQIDDREWKAVVDQLVNSR